MKFRSDKLGDLVDLGIALGWKLIEPKNGPAILISPPIDGQSERINVSTDVKSINDKVLASWAAKLFRYGDKALVEKHRSALSAEKRKQLDSLEVSTVETPKPAPPQLSQPEPVKEAEPVKGPVTSELQRPVMCERCGTKWSSWESLRAHQRSHAYEDGRAKVQVYKEALEFISETIDEALGIHQRREVQGLERQVEALEERLKEMHADLLKTRDERDTAKRKLADALAAFDTLRNTLG